MLAVLHLCMQLQAPQHLTHCPLLRLVLLRACQLAAVAWLWMCLALLFSLGTHFHQAWVQWRMAAVHQQQQAPAWRQHAHAAATQQQHKHSSICQRQAQLRLSNTLGCPRTLSC